MPETRGSKGEAAQISEIQEFLRYDAGNVKFRKYRAQEGCPKPKKNENFHDLRSTKGRKMPNRRIPAGHTSIKRGGRIDFGNSLQRG